MSDDIKTTLALVKKAKSGDEAAFNLLLGRYMQRVLRTVRMRLGPMLRGRLESMDIVQEVMIRAIKGFEQFEARDEAAFLHWINKLVQNEIINKAEYHHAIKRTPEREVVQKEKSTNERSFLSNIPADSIYRPSVPLQLKEEYLKLEAALDGLSENHREVIIMRQYEGMSFKDIGAKIGCSERAAGMQYARAMDKLTDLMTNE